MNSGSNGKLGIVCKILGIRRIYIILTIQGYFSNFYILSDPLWSSYFLNVQMGIRINEIFWISFSNWRSFIGGILRIYFLSKIKERNFIWLTNNKERFFILHHISFSSHKIPKKISYFLKLMSSKDFVNIKTQIISLIVFFN